MKKLLLLSFVVFALFSCDKDDPKPVSTIILQFDNQLRLHPDYKITYYVTEVKFTGDGTSYDGMAGYLVDASTKSSEQVVISDVPTGTYNKVTFKIRGLDIQSEAFNHQADGLTYTFTVDAMSVLLDTAPRIFLQFDPDKIKDDSANAFVVTKVNTK
jgi:hypothetical protein